jgi:hypothetical protein
MALYLVLSMPLVLLLALAMGAAPDPRLRGFSHPPGAMASAAAFGVLAALPCLLLLNAFRPLLEGSYRLVRLYLAAFVGDHAIPLAVAGAGVAVLGLIAPAGWDSRPSFGQTLGYLGGFYAVLSIADSLGTRAEPRAHLLFLLPTLRIVTLCVCARAAERAGGAGGRPPLATGAVLLALPALLALEGVWARMGRNLPATLLTAALLLLTGTGLYLRATTSAPRRAGPV